MNEPTPVLRKKPLNPEGQCAIQITYRKKGELVPLKIATGVFVKDVYFQNGLINEPDFTTTQAKQAEVNKYIIRLNKIIREFQEDGTIEPTAKDVKARYDELYSNKKTTESRVITSQQVTKRIKPLDAFDLYIKASESGERRSKSGGNLGDGTIKNYRSAKKHIENFAAHARYDINKWENINDQFYYALTDYFFDVLGHYDNNVGKNVKEIRTWLGWCNKKGIIPKKPYNENWIVWQENEVDSMVLYPDELKVIGRLPDETFALLKNGIRTRDLFLMGCLTCVRVSDLWKLNVDGGYLEKRNRTYYFSYDQSKTDNNAGVEIAPIGCKIINKYNETETGFPVIHDVTFNKDLKEFGRFMKRYFINHKSKLEKEGLVLQDWETAFSKRRRKRGKVVKIDKVDRETFTTHLMRRTGITSLAITGLTKDEIKKVSGHSTDTELDKYIKVADKFTNKTINKAWASILG